MNIAFAVAMVRLDEKKDERAAELTADVADAASSTVMNSQPAWISSLFCKRFAEKMTDLFTTAPGGSFGARVTSP